MKEKNASKLKLSSVFLLSCIFFYGTSIFGPYSWHVYSVEGLVYFAIGNVLFFIGLKCGSLVLRKKEIKEKSFSLATGSSGFLVFLSLISIVAFIIETIMFLSYYGSSFVFLGGAYHEYAEEGRTFLDQILMCTMQLGMVSYLMWNSLHIKTTRVRTLIVNIGFWTTGAFALFQGQRFSIAVSVVVFLVVVFQNHKIKSIVSNARNRGKLPRIIAVIILLGCVMYAFLHLMDTRNTWTTPMTRYEIMVGDQELKTEYYDIYVDTDGAVKSLYELASYVGESPFVFSGQWALYMPDRVYFMSNTLRPLGKVLNGVGINIIEDYETASEELGTPLRYAGFLWPLVIDYGIYFALPVAFLFGALFSKVERYRKSSFLCSVLYPCVLTMVAFAPCYFFYIGRLDWVVFEILLVYLFLRLVGRKSPIRSQLRCDEVPEE